VPVAPAIPKFAPMLAEPGTLPVTEEDDRYAYEVKYDGWRAMVRVDRGAVSISSRNALDLTACCPELAGLGQSLRRRRAVLDGEIVVLDEAGRPDFEALARG
jgi:bifunctional non-homologous end joining protein LigD